MKQAFLAFAVLLLTVPLAAQTASSATDQAQ